MFAFQEDSYRTDLEAEVVSCEPNGETYAVVLRDTVAYAESGGQPSDCATLNGTRLLDVRRDNHTIVHISSESVEVGSTISVSIDWSRRFDFMQQHSAQHLITAVAEDSFGWRTTSFHLGDDYSAIELDVSDLVASELDRLSDAVNSLVREARPIRSRWVTLREYESLSVRSRGLPDWHSGDVRLVEIEGVDRNTCGGTHVRSTAELQLIHFTGVEPARGGSRISFLAGERARTALRSSTERDRALSDALSVGPDEFLDRITGLDESRRKAARDANAAWDKWAEEAAARLAADCEPVVHVDLESPRMDLLTRLAEASDPGCERVFFGTGGDEAIVFLLRGPADAIEEMGPLVAQAVEGRGGGRGQRYQGKGQRAGIAEALNLLGAEPA